MLRTGFITFTVVAFIIGGQAFAGKPAGKGKPASNEGNLSFSVSETDRIKSDGLGPYQFAINTKTDALVLIANRGRTIFFDFSNCVSETCDTPFVTDYVQPSHVSIFDPMAMLPGESKTTSVYFILNGPDKKHPGWFVACRRSAENPPVMAAYDTDDDGKTDRWIIESTDDTVCELWTGDNTWLGDYLLPFTMVFDLD